LSFALNSLLNISAPAYNIQLYAESYGEREVLSIAAKSSSRKMQENSIKKLLLTNREKEL
jgi:hypothetical protein